MKPRLIYYIYITVLATLSAQGLSRAQAPARDLREAPLHQQRIHLIVALDNSGSLHLFADAVRRQSRGLYGALRSGDRLDVIIFGEVAQRVVGEELLDEAALQRAVEQARSAPMKLDEQWTSLAAPLKEAIDVCAEYEVAGTQTVLLMLTDAESSLPTRAATETDWREALALAADVRNRRTTTAVLLAVNTGARSSVALPALVAALGAKQLPISAQVKPDEAIAEVVRRARAVLEETRAPIAPPVAVVRTAKPSPVRVVPFKLAALFAASALLVIVLVTLARRRRSREPAMVIPTLMIASEKMVPRTIITLALQQKARTASGRTFSPTVLRVKLDTSRPQATVRVGGSLLHDDVRAPGLATGALLITLMPSRALIAPRAGVAAVINGEPADAGDQEEDLPCCVELGRYRLSIRPNQSRLPAPGDRVARSARREKRNR